MSAYSLELAEFSIAAIAITAITAYAIYWTLNESPISRWLHDSDAVVPSFLSITSFIFGLAISTLAGNSFDRHQHAITNLITETNAIELIVSTATALPNQDQLQISSAVKNYVSAVIDKEWPAMQSNDASKRDIALPEFLALNKIVNQIAFQPNQRGAIQEQLLSAIATIRHDRQIRRSIAFDNDHISKWPSIPVFSFLLLLSVGIVHLGSIKAMKVSLSIASLCVIMSAVFLFISISPYRGWNPVEPLKLQNSLQRLEAIKQST